MPWKLVTVTFIKSLQKVSNMNFRSSSPMTLIQKHQLRPLQQSHATPGECSRLQQEEAALQSPPGVGEGPPGIDRAGPPTPKRER